MSIYNILVISCQRNHHWISLPRSQFELPNQYGDGLLELGLAFERKADAPSYCKETKSEGSNGRFREVSAACKAGALPAELHALPKKLRTSLHWLHSTYIYGVLLCVQLGRLCTRCQSLHRFTLKILREMG